MNIRAFILSTALIVPMTVAGQVRSDFSSAQLSNHDRQFLHKLSSEDQSEIELARMALQKSKNPQVQNYAKTILAADPAMEHQAKQIAQQDHANLSTSPDPMQKQEHDKLSKLSGQQFDREYIQYESRKQAADLNVVKSETTAATNRVVRNYAVKEETPVWQASQSAEKIAQSMHINPVS